MGACRKGTRLNHRNGSSASSSANVQLDQADGSSLEGLPWMCAVYNDSVNDGGQGTCDVENFKR